MILTVHSDQITAILRNERVVIKMKRYQKSAVNRPKVVPFETHSSNHKNQPIQPVSKNQPRPVHLKRGRLFMLVACIMIGLSLWSLLQTFQRHQKAEEALAQTEATLHLTQDQFQQVKAEHERSQDPDYLAKLARRDYYYSKDGELIFDIRDEGEEIDHQVFQDQDQASLEQLNE